MPDNKEEIDSVLRGAWRRVQAVSPESPTGSVTDQRKQDALKNEYNAIFGDEGKEIIVKLITSENLHGNDDPEFYAGVEYSAPLMFYFMRRALDDKADRGKYQSYAKDVENMFAKHNPPIENPRIPPKKFIKDLVRPFLEELRETVAHKNLAQNDHTNHDPLSKFNHS